MANYKVKQDINLLTLILAWLLLVLLPVIFFKISLPVFLSSAYEQNRLKVEPRLYNEISAFSDDLEDSVLLNKKLMDFDAEQKINFNLTLENNKLFSDQRLKADSLRKSLEKHLGFQVFATFSYTADTQKVFSSINSRIEHLVKPPSKTMLKRFFSILNDQKSCQPVKPESYRAAFPESTDINNPNIRKNYSGRLLQLLFGTMTEPDFSNSKLVETIATKAGKTGSLFFYFCDYKERRGNASFNLGGYLAVIRLQDIPEKAFVKYAVNRKFYPDIKREIVYLNERLNSPDDFSSKISRLVTTEQEHALITMLPQADIVRRIQQGTIFPGNLNSFAEKLPVLKTSISIEMLQHPLQKYSLHFSFLFNMILLCGTMIAIRLSLFGMSFKASISTKMFLVTICSSLIPISGLLFMSGAFSQKEKLARTETLKKFLEAKSLNLEQKVYSEIEKFEQTTMLLAKQIENMDTTDVDNLQSFFSNWASKNCCNGIIFQRIDRPIVTYKSSEIENIPNAWMMVKLLFNSAIEMLLKSPMISEKPEKVSKVLSGGTNNEASIHERLVDKYKLATFSRIYNNLRLSNAIFSVGGESKKVLCYIAVSYSLEKIMDRIIRNNFINSDFVGKHADYRVDSAIIRTDIKPIRIARNCISPNLGADWVIKQIRKGERLEKKLFFDKHESKEENLVLINFSQNLPFASIVKAYKPIEDSDLFSNIFIWLYPLLIMLSALLFSDLIFVSPIKQLSRGLKTVAAGNLNHQMALMTNDEFENLAKEFNNMTRHLLEKEQLEKYVSKEILDEIEKNTESEMIPGGEKIDATVLFATIKRKSNEDSGIRELIAHTDAFLGICHTICTRNHGIIDKIIGTTIMMVFRGDFESKHHSLRACESAMQIADTSRNDNKARCYSGISSGTLVSGKIGSKNGKLDYTVIGDTVNMAARLKAIAADQSHSSIIISETTANEVKQQLTLNELEPVSIKGKKGEFRTFAICPE